MLYQFPELKKLFKIAKSNNKKSRYIYIHANDTTWVATDGYRMLVVPNGPKIDKPSNFNLRTIGYWLEGIEWEEYSETDLPIRYEAILKNYERYAERGEYTILPKKKLNTSCMPKDSSQLTYCDGENLVTTGAKYGFNTKFLKDSLVGATTIAIPRDIYNPLVTSNGDWIHVLVPTRL